MGVAVGHKSFGKLGNSKMKPIVHINNNTEYDESDWYEPNYYNKSRRKLRTKKVSSPRRTVNAAQVTDVETEVSCTDTVTSRSSAKRKKLIPKDINKSKTRTFPNSEDDTQQFQGKKNVMAANNKPKITPRH